MGIKILKDLFICFVEVLLFLKLGTIFLRKRFINPVINIIILALFMILADLILLIKDIKIAIISEIIIYILFLHILTKGKFVIKMLVYISYTALISLIVYINTNIALKICGIQISATAIKMIDLFSVLLIVIIIDKLLKDKEKNVEINWRLYLSVPSITIIGIVLSIVFDRDRFFKSSLFFPAIILMINIVFYYIISNDFRIRTENRKKIEHIETMKQEIEIYEEMSKKEIARRKLIHDYENNLLCISELVSKNQLDECHAYIEKISAEHKKTRSVVSVGNPLIDALLSIKYSAASSNNIYMSLNLCDLKETKISTYDLFAILSNLLDNAIEACIKLETIAKEIHISIENREKLIIKITNPIEHKIEVVHSLIESTKENKNNHGIGLIIVKDCVKKYKGRIIIDTDHNLFRYLIIIPNK